ncbi:MAG TPA: CHAT domain-containing protein [Pyrinomonadaceae bacterium]|nr:CHAT domain-containing protein [Pyrinomonadaceae bacterium]
MVLTATVVRPQAIALHAGSAIEHDIGSTESHSFELTLPRDQLVELTLSAQDLKLRLTLIAPDGNMLAEAVHRRFGPSTWNFIAPQPGSYRLVVSSLEEDTPKRQYRLKIDRIKTATQRDRKDVLATTDFHRAEVFRLKAENSELIRALDSYRAAAIAWQKQQRWASAADAWQQIGEVHFSRGNYQESLSALHQAARQSQKAGNAILTIQQEANIGYVHIYLGNLDQASQHFDNCKKKLNGFTGIEDASRKRLDAQLLNNYGEVENGRGNLKLSLDLFARALVQWKAIGGRQGVALAHLNLGHSYMDSGSVNEAATEFAQALRLWREIGDRRGEALTLTAQGNLYSLLGDKHAALTVHREARDFFRRIGDQQGEAVASNGLGRVFEDLNLKQEAIDNYSLALRLNHTIGNSAFEAVSAYYMGRVWRGLGDYTRALEYYDSSLTLSRRAGKLRMAMMASMDVAAIYVKQQRLAEASDVYHQTLAFYQKIADRRREALTRQGLAELFRVRGEPESAMQELRLALDLFQQIKDPQGQAESLYWLARIFREQGRLDEALAESQKSIDIIEAQRARVIGQNWRSSYFASVHPYFELQVDILMQMDRQKPDQGLAALALAVSERARARSLLELLNETQSDIPRDVDPALLARERQLRQQLSVMGDYQIKLLNGPKRETESADIELKIRNLNTEYDVVQAEIKAQSPAYSQLSQPAILNLKQIQEELKQDKNTIVIEYMLGEERSYGWLVTPTGLIVKELPGRRALEELAREVYQSLSARQRQPDEEPAIYYERYNAAEKRFCPSATELSQKLLGPFISLLKEKRLLVVADGELLYIPFDALPLPTENGVGNVCALDAEATSYVPLLTRLEVVHLPSFSSLAALRQLSSSSSRPARELVVWADPVFESDDPRIASYLRQTLIEQNQSGTALGATPVPGRNGPTSSNSYPPPTRLLATDEEARTIMKFAPAGVSMLLTGFAANRENALKWDLQNYRILHFATHSNINSRYPSLTGLLLSTIDERGQAQNGLLQLHDIYGLRLNADLVVLSGCQTGLGEELSGEGLIGLTQGFLYAGSRSVVVSLWDVQDKKTANLMANFYQSMLKDGAAPAEALHQAKLKMYQKGESRQPFYWAAFVLQGEYRTPPRSWFQTLHSRVLWSGLVLFGIVTWLLSSFWKSRRQRGQPLTNAMRR